MKVETKPFGRIIVAIDVYSTYAPVLQRALAMASEPSQLSLVYVTLPHAYFEPYAVDIGRDFVADIQAKAASRLKDIAAANGIPTEQTYSMIGDASDEIHRLAEQQGADLIVIGTHGKSGLKLLLGSTANAVLHGVKCDVLAVKV
ncbi:universal stress protein [Aestuariibacter halophilus]|uniref:Universal stress protein n=1 Tax=Fluctibacter halophilus TaxID=226011 RepID=A0ABS8G6G3_9ALTE|nr:universal stress protein [Aestuariibacter halophilus]MCC2615686.1 universal stress protein [Aestuariibacter halophilus]